MGRPSPDLLSLLLRKQSNAPAASAGGAAPNREGAATGGGSSGDGAAAQPQATPLPTSPRPSARAAQPTPVPSSRAQQQQQNRKHVELPVTPARRVDTPASPTDGSAERAVWLSPRGRRWVAYPALVLLLATSTLFLADRMGWVSIAARERGGSGAQTDGAQQGGESRNPEVRGDGSAGAGKPQTPSLDGNAGAGNVTNTGTKGNPAPVGDGKPLGEFAVRAITYSDSESMMKKAADAEAELIKRGFPHVRVQRIPIGTQGTKFEIVLFVGSGDSPRDPALIDLRERLAAVAPYSGGDRKPPFADSYVSKAPPAAGSGAGGTSNSPKTAGGPVR